MKILYVVQNYFPSIGGTQIFLQNIAERCLATFGDEGEVLTVNSLNGPDKKTFKRIDRETETINGIYVRRFPFYMFHYWLSSKVIMILKLAGIRVPQKIQRYRSGPWSPKLRAAMESTDADVICASSSNYLYMLYPLTRHKLSNPKPFVFQGAVHFSENPSKEVLFRKTLAAIQASEFYMANTQFEKDRLIGLGVEAQKIVVTGTGVDMQAFTTGNGAGFRNEFGLTDNDILVGYIGRIEVTKSINVLVNAVNCLVDDDPARKIYLVIAGFKSDYANEIESYVSTLSDKARSRIRFLFNLSLAEKVDLYHAIDLLVLPSENESFGMVFLEAWSCKKPVIGTNIGAIRSVITDGVDGLLMQPGNYRDLADKISLLSNNNEMRKTFGINGFNKTAENYTWPIITEKYRNVFSMAINQFNVQRRSKMD